MWSCTLCSHKTCRLGNIIRHIKLVHGIEDKEAKNASRETNKAVGMMSYGDHHRLGTSGIPPYGEVEWKFRSVQIQMDLNNSQECSVEEYLCRKKKDI